MWLPGRPSGLSYLKNKIQKLNIKINLHDVEIKYFDKHC